MGDIRASDNDTVQPAPAGGEVVENEVTILVTGFGPFLQQFPINPSHEITRLLPPTLTLPPPRHSPTSKPTTIRLLTHPTPLKVAYHPTATLLPTLLSTHTPDLVLHLGLAAGRSYFAAEKSSARLGYARNPDVDGRRWDAADSDRAWAGCPDSLETGLGFEGVWERWRTGCEGVEGVSGWGVAGRVRRGAGRGVEGREEDVVEAKKREVVEIRPSDDVGCFLCGFIYYTTLAWWWAREKEGEGGPVERPVLFLHVPACPEEGDVERGRDITVELIKAMVGAWVAQKERAEAVKAAEEGR